MTTQLLIEAETDGDKCGEDCSFISIAYGKHKWAYCNLELSSPDSDNLESKSGCYFRSQYCLAAAAAAKDKDDEVQALQALNEGLIKGLYEKRGLDDPEIKEAVELAKAYRNLDNPYICPHCKQKDDGKNYCIPGPGVGCQNCGEHYILEERIDFTKVHGYPEIVINALLRLAGEEE